MERGADPERSRGGGGVRSAIEIQRLKLAIKSAMWSGAGIVRSQASLEQCRQKLEMVAGQLPSAPGSAGELELRNLLLVAQLIARGALERRESRGAHYRADFPETDDKNWKKHLVYNM